MAVTILDAMTNSGGSEAATLTVSPAADYAFLVTTGADANDATGRTSVSAGGVAMTLLENADVAGRDIYAQLWGMNEVNIAAMVGNSIILSGGTASYSRSTVQWTVTGADQAAPISASISEGFTTSAAISLIRAEDSITFAVGVVDATTNDATLGNPTQSVQYNSGNAAIAYGSQADTLNTSDTTNGGAGTHDRAIVVVNIAGSATVGPTITGPDSTTEGAATVQAGTLLNTVVTQSLISGTFSRVQTIDSATATTLNYVAESGVNQCTPSTPVSGVPLEPTISAAGITPYVVQQKADDGTNPPATRNITLNPEATHEVIQTMAGVANTTPDQSVFGSTQVTVEDNHQARLPKVVDGVTFTWNDRGEFTTNIDKTVTFQYELFSPASGNWSAIDLTVRGTVILNRTFRVKRARRVIRF